MLVKEPTHRTSHTAVPSSVAANAPDPLAPLPFRLVDVRREIEGCATLIVEPESDEAKRLCLFKPGQFHMLYNFGQNEVPISISGDPDNSTRLFFTIMGVGAASRALVAMQPGMQIGLRGPFGSAWPMEKAVGKDVMIIAGGLGLAPVRPAIYSILNRRDLYNRVMLLYGTRRPETILYHEQLKSWTKSMAMNVGITVDAADKYWTGNVGLVTDLIKSANFSPTRTIAMTCGPEIMMRFVAYALMDKGMPAENIYVSMERNMKCAVGMCGRCQYGPYFSCKDGPVFSFDVVEHLFKVREV